MSRVTRWAFRQLNWADTCSWSLSESSSSRVRIHLNAARIYILSAFKWIIKRKRKTYVYIYMCVNCHTLVIDIVTCMVLSVHFSSFDSRSSIIRPRSYSLLLFPRCDTCRQLAGSTVKQHHTGLHVRNICCTSDRVNDYIWNSSGTMTKACRFGYRSHKGNRASIARSYEARVTRSRT